MAASAPNDDLVLAVEPLGFPWVTADPFLFCVHHDDHYPKGNEAMGPEASLEGRNIGMDFEGTDGWRMYHGDVVPGFPAHPHRGFETVTVARRGYIDHSDSLGATARFGRGDCQWMTAGKGVVHCEMFPLRKKDEDNPLELFQIWLNLPKTDKMVDPHFTMLWDESIPRRELTDEKGRKTVITMFAGALGDTQPPPPPPSSWAAREAADIAIWTLVLEPRARCTLPPAKRGTLRTLYFFRGNRTRIGGRELTEPRAVAVTAHAAIELEAGDEPVEFLMLQGRPIGEPVAHHGPFVMNTREELHEAIVDYQKTRFGGWPWPGDGPVHPRDQGRFARHADGREEHPGG